jgi:hypothetical protein
MSKASDRFQDEWQDPITPLEVYDPSYWQDRATRARKRARDAAANQAAALISEAADYDRLAAYAAAVQVASQTV